MPRQCHHPCRVSPGKSESAWRGSGGPAFLLCMEGMRLLLCPCTPVLLCHMGRAICNCRDLGGRAHRAQSVVRQLQGVPKPRLLEVPSAPPQHDHHPPTSSSILCSVLRFGCLSPAIPPRLQQQHQRGLRTSGPPSSASLTSLVPSPTRFPTTSFRPHPVRNPVLGGELAPGAAPGAPAAHTLPLPILRRACACACGTVRAGESPHREEGSAESQPRRGGAWEARGARCTGRGYASSALAAGDC